MNDVWFQAVFVHVMGTVYIHIAYIYIWQAVTLKKCFTVCKSLYNSFVFCNY